MDRKLDLYYECTKIIKIEAEKKRTSLINSIIRALQKFPADLSGDDSGLENVWDEICVQLQLEKSFYWNSYDRTIAGIVEGTIDEKCSYNELVMLWMQTDDFDDEENDYIYGVSESTIFAPNKNAIYKSIYNEILQIATNYTNSKIERYKNMYYY